MQSSTSTASGYPLPGGWGLIRASNTQPVLVLRFEAFTEERFQEIRSMIEQELAVAMGRHSS